MLEVILFASLFYKQLPTPDALTSRFETLSTNISTRGTIIAEEMQRAKDTRGYTFDECITSFVEPREKALKQWYELDVMVKYYAIFQDEEAYDRYTHYEKLYKEHVDKSYHDVEVCVQKVLQGQKTL